MELSATVTIGAQVKFGNETATYPLMPELGPAGHEGPCDLLQ